MPSKLSANRRPRFPNTILVVRTTEGQKNGSTIAIVRATDPDNDKVMYALGRDAQGKFKINSATGELMLNTVLDREKVEIVKFTIYAFDNVEPNKKTSIRANVHVKDVNDNPPVFSGTPYRANISEAADVDSFVFRVAASDPDHLPELIYKISDGNIDNAFKINNYGGKITTRKALDYERVKQYILNISVEDARPSAPIQHVTSTTLTVSVLDVDDNGAAFTSSNFTSHIREGVLKTVYVNRVYAFDIDSGLNAPVTYSLNQDDDPEHIFSIDSKTGVVTADGKVDREVKSKYVIEIYAKSTHHPVSKSLLIVYVDDINDNGPKFVKTSYYGKVTENSAVGTSVLRVSAIDADTGDGKSSPISYEIWMDENSFAVNDDGYISVNSTLDYEAKSLYNFKVIARQEEKAPTSAHVTIQVVDENDNSPIFQFKNPNIQMYHGSISEFSYPGSQILRVLATDKDSDVNSVVTYSIVPDALGYSTRFSIDSITGWIKSLVKLDREEVETYSLLVMATDNARNVEERRSATAPVKITVLDENDFRPIFKKKDFEVRIFQDVRVRTIVAKVQAIDLDAGNYGTLKYFIVGNRNALFSLNPNNGEIKVAESLMPYAGKTFKLVVVARDNPDGNVIHTSRNYATVVIQIYQASIDVFCLSLNSEERMKSKAEAFRKDMQELIDLDVDIVEIVAQDSNKGSEIKFNAYNKTTRKAIARPEVLRIYNSLSKVVTSIFNDKWNITVWKIPEVAKISPSRSVNKSSPQDKKKTNMTLYIVVGVCSLVAICGIIGIIYAVNAKRKFYGENNSSQFTESMIKFRNNFDNSTYWCGSQDDLANTTHRLTITSELPDLIEMYGDQDEDEPLANNNTTEEEIIIGKQLSRFDSKASSIPFANSSCGTIYRAPSLASNCSNQVPAILNGKSPRGSRGSRRRRRRGAIGRMSRSEPQLLVKRLSIVLDTDVDIIGGRRYPGTARRFHMGSTQGTC
eukprot:gene17016-18730_t